MEKNKSEQNKPARFVTESEREVAVCIAVQKLGRASVLEVVEKIEKWNGKITEKQVATICEKLRSRDLFSIDLTEKDDSGISIKRYLMKKISVTIPEMAQLKDIVDDPSINALKEELDRSKGTRKKGLKSFDYYKVEVTFDVIGEIQGFIPNDEGILIHYRDGEDIVFYQYHFKNWIRSNLPLINRASSAIGDIRFFSGKVLLNGKKIKINEKYITHIDSGFSSSKGTGGRGTRKSECLPIGSNVVTSFSFPRELLHPDKIQKAFDVICENGTSFGGNHKLSTGRLINPKVNMVSNILWEDD